MKRIEWISDEYGCRHPVDTDPEKVYLLKKEIERLKNILKSEGYDY